MKKKRKRKDIPPGCRACNWTGYVSFVHRVGPLMVDTTRCCTCAKGVWRSQEYRKRKFLEGATA